MSWGERSLITCIRRDANSVRPCRIYPEVADFVQPYRIISPCGALLHRVSNRLEPPFRRPQPDPAADRFVDSHKCVENGSSPTFVYSILRDLFLDHVLARPEPRGADGSVLRMVQQRLAGEAVEEQRSGYHSVVKCSWTYKPDSTHTRTT